MRMTNSRQKGKRVELATCKQLAYLGWTARRSQQYAGGVDSSDIIVDCLPEIHLEVKGEQRFYGHDWIAQAVRDAGGAKVPAVIWKKNRCGFLVLQRLEDWLEIVGESSYVR